MDRVGSCDAQIVAGERKPFFRCARIGFEEMSDGQPCAECRAITAVEAKER